MPSGNRDPIIAIVGNVTTSDGSAVAAQDLGKALAKAGFRILVYSSSMDFAEASVVKGYIESQAAKPCSIQVRYPLHGGKPAFPEQKTHAEVFEWIPDSRPEWEMSFYQSLHEVEGILLIGGGTSTKIAGLVAMGHRLAIVALTGFGGEAIKIWQTLRPGHDLPSGDEHSLMGRPDWSYDLASACAAAFHQQLERKAEERRLRRLEALRRETSASVHALFSVILFVLAVGCVPLAWVTTGRGIGYSILLLFFSPLLAGVAGSTSRLVFDLRQGTVPLNRQSALTTAALGLIAGGVAGALFITAQVNILESAQIPTQAAKLVPFGVSIGFIAGLTLDAVFRKLIVSDVVDLSSVEARKGQ